MKSKLLTIRAIGDSSGVVLPKELLDSLNLAQGNTLYVTRMADGILLRAYDQTVAQQMALTREVMHKDRVILRELAK